MRRMQEMELKKYISDLLRHLLHVNLLDPPQLPSLARVQSLFLLIQTLNPCKIHFFCSSQHKVFTASPTLHSRLSASERINWNRTD